MTAISSGATISCGKRAAASVANSPLARARSASARISAEAARDDLAIVELGDGREARALGDDQPQQQLAARAEHLLLEQREEGIEHVSRRARRASAATWLSVSITGATALRTSASNSASLSLEVEVERALGDAGPRRHVVEPRRLEAVLGEHRQRRIQDGLPAGLGVDFAPGGGVVGGRGFVRLRADGAQAAGAEPPGLRLPASAFGAGCSWRVSRDND